ncbi:MAG TPA: TetR/AcrR family transcriptional regulator [Caulobacteraceae bacterium]|jgi:AcrR family transcriptional regulator
MVKPPLSPKRRRTRRALVAATLAIIKEGGFEAVTLDAVARRTGVTKGAIYSNFRGKGALLWEAAGTKLRYVVPAIQPGASLPEFARAIARALIAGLPQSEREAAFFSELDIYARADPELRALRAESQKALIDVIARGVEGELGDRLTVPARDLGLAFQALIRGFSAQWAQTPDEVTEQVVATAFETLLIGATTPAQPGR